MKVGQTYRRIEREREGETDTVNGSDRGTLTFACGTPRTPSPWCAMWIRDRLCTRATCRRDRGRHGWWCDPVRWCSGRSGDSGRSCVRCGCCVVRAVVVVVVDWAAWLSVVDVVVVWHRVAALHQRPWPHPCASMHTIRRARACCCWNSVGVVDEIVVGVVVVVVRCFYVDIEYDVEVVVVITVPVVEVVDMVLELLLKLEWFQLWVSLLRVVV